MISKLKRRCFVLVVVQRLWIFDAVIDRFAIKGGQKRELSWKPFGEIGNPRCLIVWLFEIGLN